MKVCPGCGQIEGLVSYDEALWDVYGRLENGKQHIEPLVFCGDGEYGVEEDDIGAMMHAMEKNMHERGLCTECGRPDLRGVKQSDIMSREDADALADMYAEQAAERRAGC